MVWKNTSVYCLRKIRQFFFWLFGNVYHLRVFIVSKVATLTWIDPTNKFTDIEVAMRVIGAPDFTIIADIKPGIQTDVIPALDDGEYEFRVTALNGTLRASGIIVTASVITPPVDVAPDNVTNLVVTVV